MALNKLAPTLEENDFPAKGYVLDLGQIGFARSDGDFGSKIKQMIDLYDSYQVPVQIFGFILNVEQKTGKIPDKPHKSHKMQLLAYIHLVESTTGRTPPYGVLKYGNENLHKIDWNEENKHLLFSATKEVQRLMVQGGAERNHNRKGKCESCSRRYACDSSLF